MEYNNLSNDKILDDTEISIFNTQELSNSLNTDSLNTDSLNPDSLNPDSLNTDSLNTDSLNPDSLKIIKINGYIKNKKKIFGNVDINTIHDIIDKNIIDDDKLINKIYNFEETYKSIDNNEYKNLEINNLEISIIKDETSSEKKNIIKNDVNNKIHFKEVNNNEVLVLYRELLKDFNDFNESTIKGLIKLKSNVKKIEKILLKVSSSNKKNNSNKNSDWGFTEQRLIPKSIETFFCVQSNSKLSRTDVGKLFQEYIQKNNLKGNLGLKNKIDKRIYRLDDGLAKLFNLSDEEKNKINSCSSSDIKYPNGFNFYNYQKWIKKLYLEEFGDDKLITNK